MDNQPQPGQPQPTPNSPQSRPPQAATASGPQPATQNQSQDNLVLRKKIHNAGQSVFLLGALMAFLSLLSILGVKTLAENKQTLMYGYLAFVLLVSIYWITAGLKIKKSTATPQPTLKNMQPVTISAFVVFALTIVFGAGSSGLAGILALVLGIYLAVTSSQIKKLSS
jgi:amino acid transporter